MHFPFVHKKVRNIPVSSAMTLMLDFHRQSECVDISKINVEGRIRNDLASL